MKRALVTGAGGFVGANLARRLLADGHDVHLLTRPGGTAWRLEDLRGEVPIVELDLRDAAGCRRLLADIRPDWVFHLAAHGGYSWQADLQEMLETNIGGTANLIRGFLETGGAAFVHAGSSSEYGCKAFPPSETERLEPNSDYAVTKAAATLLCRYRAQESELPVVTLRLYSVYGPYEDPRRLIPTIVTRGLRGELPPLVDPDTARDFVYADDVCEAFVLAAGQPSRPPDAVYNVGTGRQTSLGELVDVARRLLPIEVEPRWGTMEQRRWDTDVWVADSSRIRAELGWQPRVDLEEGIRRTAEWFQGDAERIAGYERLTSG